MRNLPSIFGKLLVGLYIWAWSHFTEEPVRKWSFLCDFACSFESRDDGRCVVAFGVSEVAEIERGLDARIGGGEVDAAAGAGTGNIGGHAEGIQRGIVA